MTEKISVIIPVYNVENQLQTCLDSVLSQTYQNLEITLSIMDQQTIVMPFAVVMPLGILASSILKKIMEGFQMLAILVFVRLRELTSPMWMLRIG